MKRPLHRVALLQFPGVSCSRDYIQQLKEEGFTDVGLAYQIGLSQFTGAGYNWDQTRQTAKWLEEFGMKEVGGLELEGFSGNHLIYEVEWRQS